MTTAEKKDSAGKIERDLLADARNDAAWEKSIRVQPASSPRPRWYGRSTRHEPSEYEMIGAMAVSFADLELSLELAIGQLVASGDENRGQLMQAVTAEMSFDRKVHAFSSLFELKFPDEAEDPELTAIVRELFVARDERNAILHSGLPSANAKHGLKRERYVISPDRLAAIRDHIGEVGQRFARFSMKRIQERAATATSPQEP